MQWLIFMLISIALIVKVIFLTSQAVSTGAYIQAQAEKKLGRNLASGNKEKEENPGKVEKREERRRKAAGGKSGGGTQVIACSTVLL